MGQDMHLGIPPFDQFSIHPDQTIPVVIASHAAASYTLQYFQ
jgi:hypothetical protein